MKAIGRPAVRAVPVLLALALAGHAAASGPRFAGTSIGPTLFEIGRTPEGLVTYVVHGYAPANATAVALAANANGDVTFRVGGLCLEAAEASIVPGGISGNTTAWSYYLNGITTTLSEDTPRGSCKYAVRVSYALSLTGAITINQMEYTVYLRGRAAPGGAAGTLAVIP